MPTLRWQPVATLLLSIAGLGIATYLTVTHFDKVALVCSDSGTINCAKVTSSPQSVIFGIPVAMLGLAYFVPMIALCLPVAWRSTDRRVHLARLILSIVGVGTILYLLIAELFIIKAGGAVFAEARNLLTVGAALTLGAGDLTLRLGGFTLGGIGTATFGAIILYHMLGSARRGD